MRVKLMLAGLVMAGVAAQGMAQVAQPQATPPAPVTTPVRYPAVQTLFDAYIADRKMDGVVAAIGEGGAPPVFVSSGTISSDPGAPRADADSLWRVYSMTKPITAMAAMMLIEDGKLKLDQPISDILPAFKTMKVVDGPDTIASHPATKPITVRNLLTHTAGLGYTIVTKGPLLDEYNKRGINPAEVNTSMEIEFRKTRPADLQSFANAVATLPLIAEPGTEWSYSISLDVLAAVIEKAAGVSFESFVQSRIFGPLKMTSSFWTVPAGEVKRFATNYAWVGENRIALDPAATSVYLQQPSFPYGGAGLVMSARDYDRFLLMLLNEGQVDGVRVMRPETVRLAMSNLLPAGVVYGGADAGTGGDTTPAMGYAAGGSVYLRDVPGGASKGTYGWGGAAGTIAWVDPVRRIRGTVMVNYFPSDKWPVRDDVVKALYADHAPR